MCGRFLNKLPAAEIARISGTRNDLPNYPERFNITSTDRTCANITGEPNELVATILNRMLILPRQAWSAWLSEEPVDADELLDLPKPSPAERMRAYPISTKVNSVKNDEPSLLDARYWGCAAIGRVLPQWVYCQTRL
jgi:hypothetical protein